MLKKKIKHWLPKPEEFKQDKQLKQLFGDELSQATIWAVNRRSICKAVFIGLFICFFPLPGQMILAALAALLFRANLPLSVALVWISNPITILPIMYSAYAVGCILLDISIHPLDLNESVAWIWNDIKSYWRPLLLGCLVSGFMTASMGYLLVRSLWALHVQKNWERRKLKRLKRKTKAL